MIRILQVTVISALLLQAAACASAPRGATLADLRSQAQVYNRSTDFKNADSIVRFFTPDIVVMSPQGRQPVYGREANRAAWQRFFSGGNPVHTMTTDSVVIDPGGSMGYTLGQWTVGVDTPNGRATAKGHYLAVWQRRDNRWLITALTAYPFP